MLKEDLQIFHAAEVDVGIRDVDPVRAGIFLLILPHQLPQIISGAFQRRGHHIRAYAVTVVRIAAFIIAAPVFGAGGHIGQSALQNIRLVIDAVPVLVRAALQRRDPAFIAVRRALYGGILVSESGESGGRGRAAETDGGCREEDGFLFRHGQHGPFF